MTAEHPSETLDEAVRHLRAVIIAGESYRLVVAQVTGMGVTETQALSYWAVYGERGERAATDLGITSGAATALLDRLERRGVAERQNHPRDRRRVVVALTEAGRAVLEMSHKTLGEAFASVPPDELLAVSAGLGRIAADLRVASKRLLASSAHGLGRIRRPGEAGVLAEGRVVTGHHGEQPAVGPGLHRPAETLAGASHQQPRVRLGRVLLQQHHALVVRLGQQRGMEVSRPAADGR